MNNLQTHLNNYLEYCQYQKKLDDKTLKAYRIDLAQFETYMPTMDILQITPDILEEFIARLHQKYMPRTVKRKIAAVLETLFATGMRISELCSLKMGDVSLYDKSILIYGKGSKERKIQIGNDDVLQILQEYRKDFINEIQHCDHFFANQNGTALSDQAIRRMINNYTSLAAIDMHITPHMFRHTFATSLLESDVDVRYIQEMLGHSSIDITAIYTHVTMSKQREILTTKHPRKDFPDKF